MRVRSCDRSDAEALALLNKQLVEAERGHEYTEEQDVS